VGAQARATQIVIGLSYIIRSLMRYTIFAIVAVTCVSAGCRQPEGTVPQPAGEAANKTDDVSRDLLAVARMDKEAANDLRSDLENLTGDQAPPYLVEELSARIDTAVAGARLPDDAAKKLATHLYVTIAARDLSERQVDSLKEDITATLTRAGVDAPKAQPVADAAGDIQRAVGRNRRRWWHRK
jgi:hypothetical protein